ncbi:MAG: ABC transporter permease [Anaerolineae bacterium]|jgi:putative ABC transport system permease protein|nr:ABC transporter permease [Anaerolineae bacterium]MBT7602272.1 ABC transporter permease [Anaerolineae bacterium]
MSIYLSLKEVWRNKGRFFLFSMVIALIAVLVLFTAGLGEGLASANKEYLEKLDATLLVFQEGTGYSTIESRLDYQKVKRVQRVEGVSNAGPIGFSNVEIVLDGGLDPIDVSFIGTETGKPGLPAPIIGETIRSKQSKVVMIDERIAESANISVGDYITIKSTQGTEDKFYDLRVTGITDGQQYFFQPSIFVSLAIWDKYRPKADASVSSSRPITNIIAVQLQNPENMASMAALIESAIKDVEISDIKTAYESAPGYSAQQNTLNTMKGFTFLIGVLVIGGFFQIQTLQKVPQIGMLKAIGTPNPVVAVASILQIIFVTVFGVALGGLAVLGLALGMPPSVPILFTGTSVLIAVASLLLIGPLGGLVSIRVALKVEPLTALGM